MTPAAIASLRIALGRPATPTKAALRAYFKELLDTHTWIEHEIFTIGRKFTDAEIERMVSE